MKRYSIILSVLVLFTIAACSENFLQVSPVDQKVVEEFYQTPEDAFEGLVAAYDVLQEGGYGHILLMTEIASDNSFAGGGKSDGFGLLRWDWFEAQNDQNAAAWEKYFRGIYRSNVVLSKLEEVNWGKQQELQNKYEAEARFLRAYYYFDLVRLFENVPLITQPLEAGQYDQPQASPDSVYKQIAVDLKFAIENLPSVPYQQIDPQNYGRVTKWAAEALLGRVFLFYTDYYEKNDLAGVVTAKEARSYIDDVINDSGHALVDKYKNLWRASSFISETYVGENNIETVFAIKYTYKDYGNWNGANNGNRWQKFIGIRTQDIYPYAGGWGAATVNPELWNAYKPGDTRRNATIINIEQEIPKFSPVDQRQYTGYAWKKFAPTLDENGQSTVVNLGGNEQLDGFDDLPVIRFADVLLMGAELHLLAGGSKALAQKYFNRVRDRAFQDQNHRKPVSYEAIMHERRLEFAFEGQRYWDVIRQSMNKANRVLDNDGEGYFEINFRPETGGFFKIPETQINLSAGTIEQNEGW